MYSRATMLALAEVLGTEARIAHACSIRIGDAASASAWAITAKALATQAAHYAAGALGPEDELADHEPEVPFAGELVDYN